MVAAPPENRRADREPRVGVCRGIDKKILTANGKVEAVIDPGWC
jgi:hypothetical protein